MDSKKQLIGLAAICLFVACTFLSYIFNFPPLITSFCLGTTIALVLYYFLEGSKDSTFSLPWVKLTGSSAILFAIGYFGNEPIAKWQSLIEPDPKTWIALDNSGSYVPITVGRTTYSQSATSFFKDTMWNVKGSSDSVRLVKNVENMGNIDLHSLNEIGFFDSIEMQQGRDIQYSDELSSGNESSLSPVYPIIIRATTFRDEYNGFQILGADDKNILIEGTLRTRNFQFFRHNEKHYMIFVVRARHNDPIKPPWAVFGLTQIRPVLQAID